MDEYGTVREGVRICFYGAITGSLSFTMRESVTGNPGGAQEAGWGTFRPFCLGVLDGSGEVGTSHRLFKSGDRVWDNEPRDYQNKKGTEVPIS